MLYLPSEVPQPNDCRYFKGTGEMEDAKIVLPETVPSDVTICAPSVRVPVTVTIWAVYFAASVCGFST